LAEFDRAEQFENLSPETRIPFPSRLLRYCAPEAITGIWTQNEKSDTFSLRCVFYEILATLEPGRIPLRTDDYYTIAKELRTGLGKAIFNDPDLKLLATCCSSMIQVRKEDRIGLTDFISRLLDRDELFCLSCKKESKIVP
jgi:hypothetical protein